MDLETTYATEWGYDSFDWYKFLGTERISEFEWISAAKLAKYWTTCACGNQCAIIPRYPDGMPKDNLLSIYGSQFSMDIEFMDQVAALKTLVLIEKRSNELIQEITNGQTPS